MNRRVVREAARLGVARGQAYWEAHGSGPAVLLINGYGASGLVWPGGWIDELRARHTVVTVDLRGSGRARHAETPFTIGDLAADMAAVLDAADIPSAVVMGLSMGGMVAQELALSAPERVAGLLLVGTRPPVPAFTPPRMRATLRLMLPARPGVTIHDYYRNLWTAAAAPGFAQRRGDLIEEMVSQILAGPTPRAMLVHQFRAMSAWSHAERLGDLAVPTAVVHGSLDTFSPVQNGRTLARLIPGATLRELADVGHLVPLEAPEVLSAAIAVLARSSGH